MHFQSANFTPFKLKMGENNTMKNKKRPTSCALKKLIIKKQMRHAHVKAKLTSSGYKKDFGIMEESNYDKNKKTKINKHKPRRKDNAFLTKILSVKKPKRNQHIDLIDLSNKSKTKKKES